jgi:response regulator NasT
MESALIVSCTEKNTAIVTKLLHAASIKQIEVLHSAGETRRLLLERDFDLVVVNAPLPDESGEKLSQHIASKGLSQVILIVKSEFFEAVSAICEDDGVLTISEPVDKNIFWAALKLSASMQNRLRRMQADSGRLKQKIDDVRIVNRAKWILITYMNMSEQEAHRYIEKQAMDMRVTKRAIAEGILKTYAN